MKIILSVLTVLALAFSQSVAGMGEMLEKASSAADTTEKVDQAKDAASLATGGTDGLKEKAIEKGKEIADEKTDGKASPVIDAVVK